MSSSIIIKLSSFVNVVYSPDNSPHFGNHVPRNNGISYVYVGKLALASLCQSLQTLVGTATNKILSSSVLQHKRQCIYIKPTSVIHDLNHPYERQLAYIRFEIPILEASISLRVYIDRSRERIYLMHGKCE